MVITIEAKLNVAGGCGNRASQPVFEWDQNAPERRSGPFKTRLRRPHSW